MELEEFNKRYTELEKKQLDFERKVHEITKELGYSEIE